MNLVFLNELYRYNIGSNMLFWFIQLADVQNINIDGIRTAVYYAKGKPCFVYLMQNGNKVFTYVKCHRW